MKEIDVGYKDDMGLMLQMFGVIITDLNISIGKSWQDQRTI